MPAPKPAGPAALATYAAWSIVHFFTQSSFQRSFPRRLTPSRNRPGWTCHHPLPGARGLAQTFSDQHCSAHRQDKVGAASPTHTPLHTGDQQHSSRAPGAPLAGAQGDVKPAEQDGAARLALPLPWENYFDSRFLVGGCGAPWGAGCHRLRCAALSVLSVLLPASVRLACTGAVCE